MSEKFLDNVLPLYTDKGVDGDGKIIDPVHYKMNVSNKLGFFVGTTHGSHMGWNSQFYFDYRLNISPMLREYYGRCGGIFACINDYFDESIDYIFPTAELKAEFAGVINDAKFIHDNVTVNTVDTLKKAEAAGVGVAVLVEYGYQGTPIGEEAKYVSDKMTSVANQSFGATVSEVTGKLSDAYIQRQTEKGLGAYISADRKRARRIYFCRQTD